VTHFIQGPVRISKERVNDTNAPGGHTGYYPKGLYNLADDATGGTAMQGVVHGADAVHRIVTEARKECEHQESTSIPCSTPLAKVALPKMSGASYHLVFKSARSSFAMGSPHFCDSICRMKARYSLM
jgi:hypothetical protein